MEIPYTVSARPDTGLYSGKIGIWLFLASEVMLFGGLFSAYLFLRMGAEPGMWPHGLLNVPVGTANTFILIASSVTVVMSWAALKMRKFNQYRLWMALTIILGTVFLVIKLGYEYPQKFEHFGAYIKPEALAKYDDYLGNNYLAGKNLPPRSEITGHLHEETATEYKIMVDAVNADPTNPKNDYPTFIQQPRSEKEVTVEKADVRWATVFSPKHSSFFAIYFTITGLHALHIVGGLVVFLYFLGPGAALYKTNPEYLTNRVECAGLFWHFVDLVWIFAFPLFYLL
ncbi:MAG: heme-copper oxidase subunit III [Chthoniobacterales bacterium]